jgi:DNA (cytosine-5)-methyltransferase 1
MNSAHRPLRFIDLFAGIGGIRTGFSRASMECVFSCDWDKYARITYAANYGDDIAGDINEVDFGNIPSFDVLCGGFPCQPFSIAGVSKKNSLGKKHGFEDEKQGNLFFKLVEIIQARQPKVFFLENVKNLKSHDRGRTWQTVESNLANLGYELFHQVVDAKYYVPQHRERIFIVGFRRDLYADIDFSFPTYPPQRLYELKDILEPNPDPKYTISAHLWQYLQDRKAKNRAQGKGFGFGLVDPEVDSVTRTISARYYKDGSEVLIAQNQPEPRRLTPRECARLMGYSDDFIIPVSDSQAYRQFGNSVVVPVIEAIAKQIVLAINLHESGVKRVDRDINNKQLSLTF